METQKTPSSQSSLKKENKVIGITHTLISNYTTKLQSSKQYGTGTKTDTQINKTEQRAQK